MQSPHLDPIVIAGNAVAATIGAFVGIPISSAAADALGAYTVISVMAALGASLALGARPQSSRISAALYFLRVTVIASLLTVVVASLAGKWLGIDNERILLIPVAFCLGMVGDNWGKVREWGISFLQKKADSKTDGGAQ